MKKTIKDFYRYETLSDGNGGTRQHTLFNYDAIWEDEAPIFLIISERGAKGKSTQAKRLAKTIYDNEALKTMWVMNTDKLIEKEKKSHLAKPKQLFKELFEGEEKVIGDIILSDPSDKNSWYTKFAALSTAENEKGSRDDYGMLVYDEFNVGLTNIINKQTDLLSSLVGTLSDPVNVADAKFKKMIIHGNYKSLANQFLIDLDVTKIVEEVTNVYIGNFLLMRILCPLMTDDEKDAIREVNKDNWTFLLQEKLGKAGHVYFNENLFDMVNNVRPELGLLPKNKEYGIKIGVNYFNCSIIKSEDEGTLLFFTASETKPDNCFAIHVSSIEENVMLNKNLRNAFLSAIGNGTIFFESSYIREIIIKETKR